MEDEAMKNDLKKRLESALKKFKDEPVVIQNFGEIPAGVTGIARVVDCKIGTFEKGDLMGESYFFASAVVVEPEEFNGVFIKGLRTNILEPLCDTPKRFRSTVEEHMKFVLNELKKMGADTSNLESLDDLQNLCEAVKQSNIYIRFNTYKTEGSDFINHRWLGYVDYQNSSDVTKPIGKDSFEEDYEEEEIPFDEEDDNEDKQTPQRLEKGDGTADNAVIKEGMKVKYVHDDMLVEGTVYRSNPKKKVASIILDDGETKITSIPWSELF